MILFYNLNLPWFLCQEFSNDYPLKYENIVYSLRPNFMSPTFSLPLPIAIFLTLHTYPTKIMATPLPFYLHGGILSCLMMAQPIIRLVLSDMKPRWPNGCLTGRFTLSSLEYQRSARVAGMYTSSNQAQKCSYVEIWNHKIEIFYLCLRHGIINAEWNSFHSRALLPTRLKNAPIRRDLEPKNFFTSPYVTKWYKAGMKFIHF